MAAGHRGDGAASERPGTVKPGEGAGYALADIAEGLPTQLIRERWAKGEYGGPKDRPTGEMMGQWLKMAGRV